jgi:quercetin dioxygenase-like cupin family protein
MTNDTPDVTPAASPEPEPASQGAHLHVDLTRLIGAIPPDSIVSRQVHVDERVKVTLFAFAPGQELSEHTASVAAIMQVVAGEGVFVVDGRTVEVGPGAWVAMGPRMPHAVQARTELFLLLTMLKGAPAT